MRMFCGFTARSIATAPAPGILTLSAQEEVTEAVLWRAMDNLEAGAGDVINKFATETGVHLVPYDRI